MPMKQFRALKYFTWDQETQRYLCTVEGCIYRTKWPEMMPRHLLDSHQDLVYYENPTHKVEMNLWSHRRDFIRILGAQELLEIDEKRANGGKWNECKKH